jgi:predicted XRE-type DNA-binding protein
MYDNGTNVWTLAFADLKIELVRQISARLKAEGLNQVAAAEHLRISQADVSRIQRRNVRHF